ncbi:hypothetical protein H5P36_04165 [Bacillus sp. APMAM]|nr:hypothetical protein [Bacillus sp. APMAM]RTZ56172.1 hypothetical protein EKO25_09160 [Bacillus sp. SAJ1]
MNSNIKVGRVIKVIEDLNRKEIYEENRHFRSFPISIFYPTIEKQETDITSLFHPAIHDAIDAFSKAGIGEEKLREVFISVKDNATPLQNTSFPVVLLSPGFGIDRDLYIEIITAIVQKGYIVVAISVPYDSFLTVFPNGKVIKQAERFPDDQSQIVMRMDDVRLVLDCLDKWNQEEFFNGIFDTDKIGMIGHSLGGATVFNLAAIEKRVRCAILLDASLHLLDEKMPNIPILNIRQEAASFEEYLTAIMEEEDDGASEIIAKRYIEKQLDMYEHLPASSSFIKVMGAHHLSFSTIGRLISDVSPDVTISIQELTSAFLEEFLKEERGTYSERINEKNRPLNIVEINGGGFPVIS